MSLDGKSATRIRNEQSGETREEPVQRNYNWLCLGDLSFFLSRLTFFPLFFSLSIQGIDGGIEVFRIRAASTKEITKVLPDVIEAFAYLDFTRSPRKQELIRISVVILFSVANVRSLYILLIKLKETRLRYRFVSFP